MHHLLWNDVIWPVLIGRRAWDGYEGTFCRSASTGGFTAQRPKDLHTGFLEDFRIDALYYAKYLMVSKGNACCCGSVA